MRQHSQMIALSSPDCRMECRQERAIVERSCLSLLLKGSVVDSARFVASDRVVPAEVYLVE
eukprot:12809885-Prorocentrum_lima.AAC.1